ncbi:Hypothetical protein CINCED_3A002323 [Cinara cedri]|uniref:Uncharacterized protein n=1 Tax=Cinara cedri TaxID=506608 RepID=A0A5E4NCH2_9HEMI|nr:Hypothetical protein CINCED_3A002323 [Cinara cedri]
MWAGFSAVKRVDGFFRQNGERDIDRQQSVHGSVDDQHANSTDERSQSSYKTQYSTSTTKSRIALHRCAITEETKKTIDQTEDEFGCSDDSTDSDYNTNERIQWQQGITEDEGTPQSALRILETVDQNDPFEELNGRFDILRDGEHNLRYRSPARRYANSISDFDCDIDDGDVYTDIRNFNNKWKNCLPEIATLMEEMMTTKYENASQKFTNMLMNLRQNIRTSYEDLPISSLISIGPETASTCQTLLCRLDATELFSVLKNSASTSSASSRKSSLSSANTTTTSMLPTSATRQPTLVVVPGSNEVNISEDINAATFEDAFMRATSTQLTGTTSFDIFVQTGTSQKKCIATVPMKDYVKKQNPVCSKVGLVEACLYEGPGELQCTKSAFRRGDAGSRGHIGARKPAVQQKKRKRRTFRISNNVYNNISSVKCPSVQKYRMMLSQSVLEISYI